METSDPCQGLLFEDESTWSQVDFPVKTSVLQGEERVSTETAPDSGLRCSESSKNVDHDGCSLRMSLLSELEELTGFSLVWKKRGTPAGRSWWVLGRSKRRTEETESGSSLDWQTPSTQPGRRNSYPNAPHVKRPSLEDQANGILTKEEINWPTPNARDWKDTGATQGNRNSPNLGTVVLQQSSPPDQESLNTDGSSQELWPTPTVCGNHNRKGASKNSGDGLATAVKKKSRGVLNGRWVLQLMGYTSDWCDVEID
jgi:hypothetical protein